MFPMHENESNCGCGLCKGLCKGVKEFYNKVKLYFQRRNKKTKNKSLQTKLLFGDDY
jgi:hypothetical protein